MSQNEKILAEMKAALAELDAEVERLEEFVRGSRGEASRLRAAITMMEQGRIPRAPKPGSIADFVTAALEALGPSTVPAIAEHMAANGWSTRAHNVSGVISNNLHRMQADGLVTKAEGYGVWSLPQRGGGDR